MIEPISTTKAFCGNFRIGKSSEDRRKIAESICDNTDDKVQNEVIYELRRMQKELNEKTPDNVKGYVDYFISTKEASQNLLLGVYQEFDDENEPKLLAKKRSWYFTMTKAGETMDDKFILNNISKNTFNLVEDVTKAALEQIGIKSNKEDRVKDVFNRLG